MKNIILCDIDGTVANNDHRQHFLEGKKDWDGFFDALDKDKPIYPIINKIIEENNSGREIIFITGRPERYRSTTHAWLKKYFSFNIKLVMRENDNRKEKLIVKKEMFNSNFKSQEIYCVFENDEDLINLWKSLNLLTIKP